MPREVVAGAFHDATRDKLRKSFLICGGIRRRPATETAGRSPQNDGGHVHCRTGGQPALDLEEPFFSGRVQLPVETLAEYAGVYELRPGFDLTVTVSGDHLSAQATGQGAFPVYAEARDRFFARVFDIQIEFTREDPGAVTGLVLQQGPSRTEAARK